MYSNWYVLCVYTPNITIVVHRVPPDDEHISSRNMWRLLFVIHLKQIVNLVGIVMLLIYYDSRSAKH
jgi:hypothetical protein